MLFSVTVESPPMLPIFAPPEHRLQPEMLAFPVSVLLDASASYRTGPPDFEVNRVTGALASDVRPLVRPCTVKVYCVCGSRPVTTTFVVELVATCLPLANTWYDVAPVLGRQSRLTVVRLTSVAVRSAGLLGEICLFGVILYSFEPCTRSAALTWPVTSR